LAAVFFGEEELAKGMTQHVLERFSPQPRVPDHNCWLEIALAIPA
jgi:hypothetical protein